MAWVCILQALLEDGHENERCIQQENLFSLFSLQLVKTMHSHGENQYCFRHQARKDRD